GRGGGGGALLSSAGRPPMGRTTRHMPAWISSGTRRTSAVVLPGRQTFRPLPSGKNRNWGSSSRPPGRRHFVSTIFGLIFEAAPDLAAQRTVTTFAGPRRRHRQVDHDLGAHRHGDRRPVVHSELGGEAAVSFEFA